MSPPGYQGVSPQSVRKRDRRCRQVVLVNSVSLGIGRSAFFPQVIAVLRNLIGSRAKAGAALVRTTFLKGRKERSDREPLVLLIP